VLVLLFGDSLLSLEDGFSVLVNLERGHDAVGRVDGDLHLASYAHNIRKRDCLPLVFSRVSFSTWMAHLFL
jgi:hypothetical protein